MKAYNVAYSINSGCSLMLILDDTEEVIMFDTRIKASLYITKLREKGYTGEVCLLVCRKISP